MSVLTGLNTEVQNLSTNKYPRQKGLLNNIHIHIRIKLGSLFEHNSKFGILEIWKNYHKHIFGNM